MRKMQTDRHVDIPADPPGVNVSVPVTHSPPVNSMAVILLDSSDSRSLPSSSSISPPLSLDSSSVERTSADESTLREENNCKINADYWSLPPHTV